MLTEIESDIESLVSPCSSLMTHHSQEIGKTFRELYNVLFVILMDHLPSFRRRLHEPRLGYSYFAGEGEQALANLLKKLHAVLKGPRVLLKRKGRQVKVLNSIRLPSEDLLELQRVAAELRNLVFRERLTGYVPYMLHKFRAVAEWRHSRFGKMGWPEVGAALAANDESLNDLLSTTAHSLVYDVKIVRKWVQLGSALSDKDTYLGQCVKDHDTYSLRERVWRDENHLEFLAIDDDLETRAYLLAFKTFREEWFSVLREEWCQLTEKAIAWLAAH